MIYFDNAATSFPKAPPIYSDMGPLYQRIGVSPMRGSYAIAKELGALVDDLRNRLAMIFGVSDSGRVIITPSATVALNQVIHGIDFNTIKNVYISPFEHNAVIRPLKAQQKKFNFALHILPFSAFSWDEEKTKLFFKNKSPDLVFCTHASNVFGNVLPVKRIFQLGKKYGAINILDCAQTAGLLDTNLVQLQADYAVFAGHKTFYGPSGIGGLIINSSYQLMPLIFGGTGMNSEDEDMPDSTPERYEAGSLNSLGIIGLSLAIDWLNSVGTHNILKRKSDITAGLFDALAEHKDIFRIVSDRSVENVGIVSVTPQDYLPSEIAMILDTAGICVRHGLHCSPLAHKHIGTVNGGGTVRFSVSYLNTEDNIISLNNILGDI